MHFVFDVYLTYVPIIDMVFNYDTLFYIYIICMYTYLSNYNNFFPLFTNIVLLIINPY